MNKGDIGPKTLVSRRDSAKGFEKVQVKFYFKIIKRNKRLQLFANVNLK